MLFLSFDDHKTLVLQDCLDISKFSRNLIFVACLHKHRYNVVFNSSFVIRMNKGFIYFGLLRNKLFILSSITFYAHNTKLV